MKKFANAVLPTLLSLFFLCCMPGIVHAQAEKNLEAANKIINAIQTGDVSTLDDVIAEDAVDHAGMMGEINGRDSIKAELGKIHTMATDMSMEKIKELADDEYVFQWIRFSGTASTPDMGMPVGTKFDLTAIEVLKFRDGMVIEHWEFMQPSDMMKMMQQQQPGMNNNNMPDSTNNK